MFIVVSLVDKWKKVYGAINQGQRGGSAMLLSLFITCVFIPLRC